MTKYATKLLLTSFISVFCLNTAQASPTLEALKKETQAQLQHFASGELRCFPEMKLEAEAHIIYSTFGAKPIEENVDNGSYRFLDIRVEETDKPALLVLSAYEPIVWRVKIASGANVAGVYMAGKYEQMITGLPKGIPVTRTQTGFRSEGEKEECLYYDPVASDESSPRITLEQAKAQLQKLSLKLRPIRKKFDEDLLKLSVYKEIRGKLSSENVEEKVLISLDEIIVEKTKELDALQGKVGAIQKRLTVTRAQTTNPFAGKLIEEDRLLSKPAQFTKFEEYLTDVHLIPVASYQRVFSPRSQDSAMVISSESAQKYQELIASGIERLSKLELPKFNIVGLDKANLAAPSDQDAGNGLDYLVNKGYLLKDDQGGKYHCERVVALLASKGFERKFCGPFGDQYIITGPIVFPQGLCNGEAVTFFVAPDVPKPIGNPCHSEVVYLDDKEPCLADSPTCLRRNIRKNQAN